MKIRKLVVTLYAAGVMTSSLAHATNGDTMMAVGTENTALGGTGVAHFVGAESTFANPAMLGKSSGQELVGGVVLFSPKVTNNGMQGTIASSAADTSYIPDISYSSRINEHWTYGVAMAGIAGMGVDYTGLPVSNTMNARTQLSILKIVPTIAYNDANYGFGFSPVLQYGSLAMSFDARPGGLNINPGQTAVTDTRVGYTLGAYYMPMPTLTLGAAYNSKIKMNYGPQISYAAAYGFGQSYSDNLTQPAEIKAGVSYDINNNFTVTADFRQIQWAYAQDYGNLAWRNENVTAIGVKYKNEGYWLGAGYNNSNNPIGTFANGVAANARNGQNGIGNLFNNLMFPGIIKSSYTLGGGYMLSKNYELAGSIMYAPKVTSTVDISDAAGMMPGSLFNTTTHSQQSFSVSLRYKF